MDEREDEYRRAAAECLELARATAEPSTRIRLFSLALNWLDLANKYAWARITGPTSRANAAGH